MHLHRFFGSRTMMNSPGGQGSKRRSTRLKIAYLLLQFSGSRLEVSLFRLFIAAEEKVIGATLTQEAEGQEYIVTYLSRRLLDAESRYSFVERLCLSLYFACTKLRHYLLSSECKVFGQTDVLKHMIQRPILSG